ncbi:MAG: T9SS type A sorting domain-containing protein [Bacteroidota bacterium]|nr:T9SS type A sorting domain-containing protein [Bacteroidota bacterium]
MKINHFLSAVIFLTCNSFAYSQFLNTNAATLGSMIQNLQGPGLQILSPSGQYQSGCGLFTNNGISAIPYASGVIMSTGSIDENPLNDTSSFTNSTNFGLPGDVLLNDIIAPFLTYDNQFLEFDFVAGSDTVFIEAIFASEEYNEKVNQQTTDIFRILISGPGFAPNTTVSTIPGTQIPVGINTINNGQSTGTSTGPCLNCNYYIDNVATGAVDLGFDGYTTPFIFKIPVMVCETYHLKISIADVFDGNNDSFILLKGNGFRTSGTIPILVNNVPAPPNDTVYICQGGSLSLSLPPAATYSWSTGDTTQTIVITQPGVYSAAVFNSVNSCFAFTTSIVVIQQGSIQTPVINQNGNVMSSNNIIPAPGITYQWSLNGVPITGAMQDSITISGNGCYTLTIFENNCSSISNSICVTNTSFSEMAAYTIRLVPHPVTSVSILETFFEPGSTSTLHVVDITGKIALPSWEQTGNSFEINKKNLPPGIYYLEIQNSNYHGVIRKKIIVL